MLGTLYYAIKADTSDLIKKLDESEKKIEKMGESAKKTDKNVEQIGKSFLSLADKVAGFLGVGLSVGAAIHGINEAVAENFEMEKLAVRFRTSAEAVDEFLDAADLLKISGDKAKDALTSLDAAIQDTAMGMGRAAKVFKELHINVKDSHGHIKATTAVMGELQSKFNGMDKGKQIRIMERLGLDPSLLKLFNADMADLRKRMEEVDRMTGFSLQNAIQKSGEFTKASKEMWLEIKTLKLYFDKLYEGMNIAAMPMLAKAMNVARDALHGVFELLKKHGSFAEGMIIAISGAFTIAMIPALQKSVAWSWALIGPYVGIAAAVLAAAAAFAVIYDDIMTFRAGGDSVIGMLLNDFPAATAVTMGALGGLILRFVALKAQMLGAGLRMAWLGLQAMIAGGKMRIGWLMGLGPIGLLIAAITGVIAAIAYLEANWTKVVGKISEGWQSLKSAFGFGDDSVQGDKPKTLGKGGAVDKAQAAIVTAQSGTGIASAPSPLAAATAGGAINKQTNKTTTVNVQKVEVKTQATDAAGISKAIGNQMQTQLRQAAANFDDGVLA